MSQHIGFRCPDELAEAIQQLTGGGKDRTSVIVDLLRFALSSTSVEQRETLVEQNSRFVEHRQTSVEQNDERLQELIDAKTSYLATAMNEATHLFENKVDVLSAEIEELKARLSQQETLLGES